MDNEDKFLSTIKKAEKDVSRLRSEVRELKEVRRDIFPFSGAVKKETNPFTGLVSGNYWTQTGMPWISSEGRKAVLTEWFWQPIRGQPRRVDTNELRQFSQTFWVNSCVTTYLDEITSIDWDIVPQEDFDYESVRESIVKTKSFLKFPNKNRESFNTVLRALLKDTLEIDAGVLVKVFSIDSYDFDNLEPKSGAPTLKPLGQRQLTEIYCRDGASFLAEADKFGLIDGWWQYSYQIPAHPMWFNRDEIAYLKEQPRSMSPYGYARTQAILDIIKSLHYSTLFNKSFFEETAIPDGILSVLNTNESEMNNFMQYWNNEFKGQPHKLAVVNKDVKWNPFSFTNQELEFLETQSWYYKMIIIAFGLTPSELGVTDGINRATSATQAEVSKRRGIRPKLRIIENLINEEIIPEFGFEGIEFQFVYDDPVEKSQRLANWKTELELGLKTINEVRNEEGLEPVEWGNQPNVQQYSLQNQSQNPENPQENPDKQSIPEKDQEKNGKRQDGNHQENQRREEGKAEIKDLSLDYFHNARTPIGSTRSAKTTMNKSFDKQKITEIAEKENISPSELLIGIGIEMEHLDAVNYDELTVIRIAVDHLHEVADYYSKLQQVEKKNKGIDDGQYYRPQTFRDSQINPQVFCPQCGRNTLSKLESEFPTEDSRFKCINCGHVLNPDEIDRETLASMENTFETNNRTKPITPVEWSPKNHDCDMLKEYSTIKEYCGFDYEKSLNYSSRFVTSPEYLKMLAKYLNDLSENQVRKIIRYLEEGLKNGKSLKEISNDISKIISDERRASVITRTEIIRITNEGRRLHMEEKGISKVEFISAPEDGRLCDTCKSLDGKIYTLERIRNIIPLHAHCRCTFTEVA